ncbi:hypothetical protein BRC2024_KCUCJSVR_CDS_0094 [Acinetobacter phage vB_AbaM_KissB]|uniref:hypothetical protein n=1 Tax=Acinetobacter phage vB_AbaM_phiAbaA1 TaxID=1605379 RepID=UPI00078E0E9A|nr:hypothetical protein BJD49_gp097 [Acinetobacter phage vB_AbaM_phiAbaA1]AJK27193.1 hypothetical protein phiAbaA1_090 [Acinetobacter phage vB_AbaM_phiAbaA1]
MWRGRAISFMIIDDCLHDIVTHDDMMKGISERLLEENIVAPAFDSVGNFKFKPRYANMRQQESNDWRRKGKRGFNGYHRYG